MPSEQELGGVEYKSLCQTLEGAWDEALAEFGFRKVILVTLMLFMTVPFAPLWMSFVPIERTGYYHHERGGNFESQSTDGWQWPSRLWRRRRLAAECRHQDIGRCHGSRACGEFYTEWSVTIFI